MYHSDKDRRTANVSYPAAVVFGVHHCAQAAFLPGLPLAWVLAEARREQDLSQLFCKEPKIYFNEPNHTYWQWF
jgi:hypothetical protein